jgi:hypothetical protein
MEQTLSPLNQGLNPLRAAGQWGQLVAQTAAAPVGAPQCQQRSPLGLTRPPGGLTDDHATAL